MTQTFTSKINDVIRYLYDETSNSENVKIEKSLTDDLSLLDFYLDSLSMKAEMNRIAMVPSDLAINRILAFSRNYEPAI